MTRLSVNVNKVATLRNTRTNGIPSVVKAARRPIVGARKAARFLIAVTPNVPATATIHDAVVNGQPGLLVVDNAAAYLTMSFDVLDDRIVGIRVVSNPEKLTGVKPPS